MSPLKTGITVAVAAVVLTSGWRYHDQQQRRDEAARLSAENDQLRLQTGQRDEIQRAPSQAPGVAQALPAASTERSVQPEGTEMRSALNRTTTPGAAEKYRNEGMATPHATLQTLAWACDRADAALMEKLLVYDEDARQKTLQYFAAQKAGNPSELPSIQTAAALLYIEDGMHHPYPQAAILTLAKFEPLRPDRVRLHLPGSNGDRFEFQQTVEGWKLAVTLAVVEDYIRQSAKRASKP